MGLDINTSLRGVHYSDEYTAFQVKLSQICVFEDCADTHGRNRAIVGDGVYWTEKRMYVEIVKVYKRSGELRFWLTTCISAA